MFVFRKSERRVSVDEARTRTGGEPPEAVLLDVKGGMNAWAAAGYPVVDERGNSGSIA
ncbi:hypothetical protein [Streptomyces parvulus]|uniref:hypothetical protein n=1 Tax=Streptomyces parvulus TaxID=146923 RepID=UPI0033C872A0